MAMSKKAAEYLRRQRELGYEPSLAGLDEEDFDYVPSWSQQNPDRPPAQELAPEYKPVDRDFAERIFKLFARPFDPNWQMPDLEGPEYSQAPKLPIPSNAPTGTDDDILNDMVNRPGPYTPYDGPKIKTLEYHFDPVAPSDNILLTKLRDGGDGQPGSGNEQRGWRGTETPSRAGSDRQEAWRRYGEMQNEYKQPQYKQGWLDDNVWKSPEVQNAATREEREAAINRIIDSPAGEDLRKHYSYIHGNENDADLARQNDVRYILDAMDGTKASGQTTTADVTENNNSLSKALDKAINITGSFEGHKGYENVAGNFDGAGLSLGKFQWNIASGSLQPMLSEFIERNPEKAKEIFGTNLESLTDMLNSSNEKQMEWARSINKNGTLLPQWQEQFTNLCKSKEFQEMQRNEMQKYINAAHQIADDFNLKSERGLAFGARYCGTERWHLLCKRQGLYKTKDSAGSKRARNPPHAVPGSSRPIEP